MSETKAELRIVTYMCPTHSAQLYELIMEYLESMVNCSTSIHYESRGSGPLKDLSDPFKTDKTDLAFMTASAYMKLKAEKNPHIELLPVTPVFQHDMNLDKTPGYFSDVIVHSDKKAHNVKTLLDLRGCIFAYSDEESLSGSKMVLKTLKRKGDNATFFGSKFKSGSHLSSARMVQNKQADWAAVDSTTLLYSRQYLPDGGKDIRILETLGRLPPYPIVVNKKLSNVLKTAITEALLKVSQINEWKEKFLQFGIINFSSNSDEEYVGSAAQVWSIPAETLHVPYY